MLFRAIFLNIIYDIYNILYTVYIYIMGLNKAIYSYEILENP
jgi:hypothetical protein